MNYEKKINKSINTEGYFIAFLLETNVSIKQRSKKKEHKGFCFQYSS